MRIVESRSSNWFFHLSTDPLSSVALCGAPTMYCPDPVANWGVVTHVGEKYCAECGRLAGCQ